MIFFTITWRLDALTRYVTPSPDGPRRAGPLWSGHVLRREIRDGLAFVLMTVLLEHLPDDVRHDTAVDDGPVNDTVGRQRLAAAAPMAAEPLQPPLLLRVALPPLGANSTAFTALDPMSSPTSDFVRRENRPNRYLARLRSDLIVHRLTRHDRRRGICAAKRTWRLDALTVSVAVCHPSTRRRPMGHDGQARCGRGTCFGGRSATVVARDRAHVRYALRAEITAPDVPARLARSESKYCRS